MGRSEEGSTGESGPVVELGLKGTSERGRFEEDSMGRPEEGSEIMRRDVLKLVPEKCLEVSSDRDTGRLETGSTSGEAARPDASPVVNKWGHALHELQPWFRAKVREEKIKQVLREVCGFEAPRCIQSMVICKSAEVGGEVSAHVDGTFLISEPQSVAGFWIALSKATVKNGCMFFVPGSHKNPVDRLFVRHPNTNAGPTVFEPETFSPYNLTGAVPVEAEEGDLVVFHGAVVHFSAPNTSNLPRPAYTMHFVETKNTTWSKRNWLQSTFFNDAPLYGGLNVPPRIPTVCLDPSQKRPGHAARSLDLAMREFGCAILIGHGLNYQLVAQARARSREFFLKARRFKHRFQSPTGYGSNGYNPAMSEAVAASELSSRKKIPDPLESFYIRPDFPDFGPESNEFFKAVYAYRTDLQNRVIVPFMKLAAQALGLNDENAFVDANEARTRDVFGILKISRYPPHQPAAAAATSPERYGAHTDWEGFTFLLPDENDDEENGLEVLYNSQWIAIGKVPRDGIIVNAGDFAPLWTELQWKSPLHRVVAKDLSRDRLSIPFFVGPSPNKEIQSLMEPKNMKKNTPRVFAGEWLEAKRSRARM